MAFSCDKELADQIRRRADEEGKTLSEWLRDIAYKGLGLFFAGHLAYYWLTDSKDWASEGLAAAIDNGSKIISFAGDIISQLISQ